MGAGGDGATECVLLVGESGTGRTASVGEVRMRLADEAGFALSGSWGADPSRAPYSGLMKAVDQALTNLLQRADDELTAWRQRVRRHVGVHEELLTRLAHGRMFIGGEDPGPQGAAHTELATDWRGRCGRDRYLRSAGVRSLLCVPVAQPGRVVAVLYLENRLTARAFPSERLALVTLLAGQAAISIENARAYAALEQRVVERTRELEALDALQNTQRHMVEAEQMASLGQLTAGVAHEINKRVNFVVSSVPSLRRDLEDLRRLMAAYEAALAGAPDHPALAAARELRDTLDGDYLQQEVGELLAGIAEGADRTAQIVKGLRYFSRLDEDEVKAADVREGLEATLMLLRQQYQGRITVERQYDDVPAVECYPGQLNQLFMNLLVNAGQAIKGPGTITLAVRRVKDGVAVTVRDTGPGIPPEVQRHIFEPFFTTKPVGEGTGLGLSISYGIVERHHGTIQVDTAPGGGTAFTVWLPQHQPTQDEVRAEPG